MTPTKLPTIKCCDNPLCINHGPPTNASWNDPIPEGYQRYQIRESRCITVCKSCENAIDMILDLYKEVVLNDGFKNRSVLINESTQLKS